MSRGRGQWAGFCLLAGMLLAGVVAAQTASGQASAGQQAESGAATGTIAGVVVDPTGAVIPQATVTLRRTGVAPVTVISNAQGGFSVAGLAPGVYEAEAQATGFRTVRLARVTVRAGGVQRVSLTLSIEVQQQQVTVSAETLDSSPDKNGSAVVLKGSDLDALDDDPDTMQEEIQAIAGSDPDTGTQFFVDGFSGSKLPPKSAIREIRINSNPYSAQYDEIGWGRIEIFTKPGADKWHGDWWMRGNDSSFNSRNPFVTTQPPYQSLELEGDVNGPVTKKSSQFTDLYRESSSDDSIVDAEVLNSSLAQVPFTQTVGKTNSFTDYSTRFDWSVGKVQTLTLRYHLQQETQGNGGVGQFALASQAFNSNNTEQVLQFSDSQLYGVHLLNETRFQYIRDRNRQTPETLGPTIVVQGGFTGGGSNLGLNNDAQDHYELQNYVQSTRGKHTVDFGARLRGTRDSNYSTANFNGQYTFATLTAYQITQQGMAQGWTPAQIRAAGGGASLFSQTSGTPAIVVNVFDAGLYAEDNWKVRKDVTLSYGLRFETQTEMPDHADWAPRLGVSWAIPHGKNKPPLAVIRSGFGLFYTRFPSLNVLEAKRENGVTEQTQVVNAPDFYPSVCSSDPGACSGATTLAPTIFSVSPTLRAPYEIVSGVSVDKPLGKIASISLNYLHWRGDHLFLTRNINAPLPGTYNTADPTSGVRPLGTDQNIYQYESEGTSVRDRLAVNGHLQTKRVGLFGYYMLNRALADTSGIGNFPSNQYDLRQDWGRASNDIRSRLFFGGFVHLWKGFGVNPFLIYQTSTPFNIVVGQDLNGDTQFNDRPAFATDLTRASVVRTPLGVFDTDPMPGQTIIPINYGNGPGVVMLNMRVTKDFHFGPPLPQETPAPAAKGATATTAKKKPPIERKYTMGFALSSENVVNHVNLAPPVGVLGSPLFGQSTALASTFGSGSANRTVNVDFYFRF